MIDLDDVTAKACSKKIAELREQVEKLTKERDAEIARNKPLRALISSLEETKSILLKKSAENKEAVTQLDSERQANAALTEELAALAEQNARLREALTTCVCAMQDYQAGIGITDMFDRGERLGRNVLLTVEHPDLASPVLNRIRAEGMRMAAEICDEIDNDEYRVMQVACAETIRARADELEKSNADQQSR